MEHLKQYLAASGTKQSALAEQLGISRGYMSEIVGGTKIPSLVLAFRLERATGGAVPAVVWVADDECPAPTPETPAPENKDAA